MELNTDRMWWTIGIIVIGGALVAAAMIAFPAVLDSVIDFFQNTIGNAINDFGKS